VPTPTDRTTEPTALRVTLSTGAATGTVPVGPSASENADGPGSLPTTGAISRHARVTENVRYDSEVTAVSHQRTRTPSTRDSGTPHPQAIAAAMRRARTTTAAPVALPGGAWRPIPGHRRLRLLIVALVAHHARHLAVSDVRRLRRPALHRDQRRLGTGMDHHRTDKPWWPEVEHVIATFVGPRRTALVMERDAIRSEMPAHNIACKPGARPGAVA
jgi:hypothetical protein